MNYKTEYLIIFVLAIVVGFSLAFYVTHTIKNTDNTQIEATENLDTRIQSTLQSLSEKNFASLSSYIHPQKNLTFAPYQYIDPAKHKTFTANEVSAFGKNFQNYTWGEYDGSGEPITLNINEYWDKFVYDNNYLNNAQVGYNKQLSNGNAINNINEIFPDSTAIEYYIAGTEQYGGMDWTSLTLVFEEYENELYLVAIVHGEWTI